MAPRGCNIFTAQSLGRGRASQRARLEAPRATGVVLLEILLGILHHFGHHHGRRALLVGQRAHRVRRLPELLALRPRAVSWLAAAPAPTLRVLLHSCRAQPALGAALATDVELQATLWELAASSRPVDDATSIRAAESDVAPLLALHLLAVLLAHGAQQTTQQTRSEAVQAALPHVPSLSRLLVPLQHAQEASPAAAITPFSSWREPEGVPLTGCPPLAIK